jgi:hypothetical protein
MWVGYGASLQLYYNTILQEWIDRGYNNTMQYEFLIGHPKTPIWLTEEFCSSHRSNLIRKDPIYYSKFGWTEDGSQEYIWPIKRLDKSQQYAII